jgi:hypothetical protein
MLLMYAWATREAAPTTQGGGRSCCIVHASKGLGEGEKDKEEEEE